MADKPWDDPEQLRKLYWDDELNMREISNRLGCSRHAVALRMKKYKMPVRTRKEISRIASARGAYDKLKSTSTLRMNEDNIRRMYVDEKMSIPVIAKHFGSTIGSVDNFMRHNGIASRSPKEAGKLRRGENSPVWGGGRYKRPSGYIAISVAMLSEEEQELFRSMLKRRRGYYIEEHRLVMARRLGRPLLTNEIVHHLNGIKDDNRDENLILLDDKSHRNYIPALKKRIKELEDTVSELRKQISNSTQETLEVVHGR